MTNFGQKPSAEQVLSEINRLSAHFNQKAQMDNDVIAVLSAAAETLQAEQKKNAALEKKLIELENNETFRKAKSKNFTFLVGSAGPVDRQPIQDSCDSVLKFKEKSGTSQQAIFFGGEDLCLTSVSEANFNTASEKLYEDTHFSPVIDYLESVIGSSKTTQHFVVMNDGKLALEDFAKTTAKMESFLKQHPKATVDFIFVNRYGETRMQQLSKNLQAKFPNQISSQRLLETYSEGDKASLVNSMDTALANAIKARTAPAPKKEIQPQPKR